MKRFITSNPFLYTIGLVLVFVLWLIISFSLGQGNLVFPSPFQVFGETGRLLGDSFTYKSIGLSLLRTLEGFGISFVAALALGSLAGEIKPLQKVLKPLMIVLKSAPTAAFVFLFILLSGSSIAPIYIVTLLAFPILYESVVAGFNAVDEQLINAARLDGTPKWKRAIRIELPLALPFVILGMVNSFALSFKTEIMAEIISGDTNPGIGGYIRMFRNGDPSDLTPIFALALIAITIILLVDLASYLVKRKLSK